MAKMVTILCACGCDRVRRVRKADVERGWGLYFSKSCKAKHQARQTGRSGFSGEHDDIEWGEGWDGHKECI